MTTLACNVGAALSRISRKTVREVSSISTRLRYLVGVLARKGDVAVECGSTFFEVLAVSDGSRSQRVGRVSSQFYSTGK